MDERTKPRVHNANAEFMKVKGVIGLKLPADIFDNIGSRHMERLLDAVERGNLQEMKFLRACQATVDLN